MKTQLRHSGQQHSHYTLCARRRLQLSSSSQARRPQSRLEVDDNSRSGSGSLEKQGHETLAFPRHRFWSNCTQSKAAKDRVQHGSIRSTARRLLLQPAGQRGNPATSICPREGLGEWCKQQKENSTTAADER